MFGVKTGTTPTTSTGDNNIDGLIASNRWASVIVTYSFTDNFANDYESGYPDDDPETPTHSGTFQP